MNIEQLYELYLRHPVVATDTRKVQNNDLFFALKGPTFNGNSFARHAIEKGAVYAIIDDREYNDHEKMILVDDVLSTLQQLAKHHRERFNIPFLAITGSNGKTTTKELIHAVLSLSFKTYTTRGNLNNHIGIPLTLLSIKKDAEIAVIEMGANHQKEIEGYCRYTMPTHGIITNCGKAHLEGFGGVEGVRKGKGELFDYLRLHKGTVFVMWDYDYLRRMSEAISSVVRYGTKEGDIIGYVKNNDPFLEVSITKGLKETTIRTQLVGDYNLPNVLAAVATAKYFNVGEEQILSAIAAYAPSNSRSQMIQKGSNKIILDAYNANPTSMKMAIENFAGLRGGNKVLVLGAMAELGPDSIAEHESLVQLISTFRWKEVVLVGGDFLNIHHPYLSFKNSSEARQWYLSQHFEHTLLLLKGSRSIQIEKIVE